MIQIKKYMQFGLVLFLSSIFLTGIFNFTDLFLYSTERVTTEVKDHIEDVPSKGEIQLNTPEKEENIKEPIETQNEDLKADTVVEKEIKEEDLKEEDEIINNDVNKEQSSSDIDTKIAYLTFDDGPSPNVTPVILDILNEYDIKATFFVLGNQVRKNPEVLLKIAKEGHLIGNHTYSHDYKYIYKNSKNFLSDLKRAEDLLNGVLGEELRKQFNSTLIRFPGGSFGDKKASTRKAVLENGYKYVDWNVLNGDAEGINLSVDKLVARFKQTLRNQHSAVILMHDHDAKKTTAESLPEIIEYLQSEGYTFKTLADFDFKY
ncbi:MAG: polysaccharide deacetylase [Clostridiales bacterium]|nr:polysaccharide deacetylase [Clostridiales bacterium]